MTQKITPKPKMLELMCPNCDSSIEIISLPKPLLILKCPGCGRFVVSISKFVFSLSKESINKLESKFSTEACGKVIGYDMNTRYEYHKKISNTDIDALKEALEGSTKDILDCLEDL